MVNLIKHFTIVIYVRKMFIRLATCVLSLSMMLCWALCCCVGLYVVVLGSMLFCWALCCCVGLYDVVLGFMMLCWALC